MCKMYNYESSAKISKGYFYHTNLDPRGGDVPLSNSTNKYVYVKQSLINPSHSEPKAVISKVLVNPHFSKTVFVNPNFNINTALSATFVPKIHVNPKVQKINVNIKDCRSVQKIHVNPNVLRNVPITLSNLTNCGNREVRKNCEPAKDAHSTVYSAKTELINTPMKTEDKQKKRRSSVRSKFKIIKSSVLENSLENKSSKKRRPSLRTKYKIIKSTCSVNNCPLMFFKHCNPITNKFKVDNRNNSKTSALSHKNRRYIYVNRFLSISDIARNNLLKQSTKIKKLNFINISGIVYKKSPNSLRRTSNPCEKINDVKKSEGSTISKPKFKFIKKSQYKKVNEGTRVLTQSKILRTPKVKKSISPGKLRKCNMPCPYYRKYGKCKGKDSGKCYRKHDPDQIALCTKFLQGACVDKKCLLSHNVSPEKMPTCKFYLEGSCSRDDCPYLHVRISPKADICRDFLEGFCKKASQCDKRHQFLCPDHEKTGCCLKQRCPYPHGKMVRKYSVVNKNKFAKKSSDDCKKIKNYDKNRETNILINRDVPNCESENLKLHKNSELNVKNRYYTEQNITVHDEICQEPLSSNKKSYNNDAINCDQESGMRSRPKLGKLPSFIAFEEV